MAIMDNFFSTPCLTLVTLLIDMLRTNTLLNSWLKVQVRELVVQDLKMQ